MNTEHSPLKVAVLGDAMLDCWQEAHVQKVSQEAPVLVVKHKGYTYSAGGAGNAAVNCAHLGADTTLIAIVGHGVGNDSHTFELRQALMANKVNCGMLVNSPYLPTIEKLRVVDELGRHIVRIDKEEIPTHLDSHDISDLHRAIEAASKVADVLFISDYGKGVCQPAILRTAIGAFKGKFIVVNGKPEHALHYGGADVLVFNREEMLEATRVDDAKLWGTDMLKTWEVKNVVVTRGAEGLEWVLPGLRAQRIPAPAVAVADVAGAGDSLCASIAVAGKIDADVLRWAIGNAAKVVSQHGTSVPV